MHYMHIDTQVMDVADSLPITNDTMVGKTRTHQWRLNEGLEHPIVCEKWL